MKRARGLFLIVLIMVFFVALSEARASDPLAESVADRLSSGGRN
jgi:hypothetical protein